MNTSTATKPERLEVRVTREQKKLVARAAELDGRTITDFVLAAVASAAKQVIQEHETLKLTERDREVFAAAVMNPPKPNERLRQAVREYRETIR